MKPLSRDEYERVKQEYLEDKRNGPIKQPGFNKFFKFNRRALMKKSIKKNDEILVFLLNLKKQLEGPILTKIYGGNFLVVRNRVYRFNPDRVFTFANKYKCVIAREFDRELVGIDDYEALVFKDFASPNPGGRVNIDDPVLIKALIQAKLSEKTKAAGNKWIIIILVIIGLIVGFLVFGKSTPTPEITPPTTP